MAVLTISRDVGSEGRRIGLLTAQALGYGFLDRERILARVREAGRRWEKWSEGLDEHTPRLWERYDRTYLSFIAMVQAEIMKEAASGRVVIMGRGGNYLLRGVVSALRVRVVASLEERIARVSRREDIDEDSARRLIENTEREREGFLLSVYGRNGKAPADYDLTLDTTGIPAEQISARLCLLLSEKDSLAGEEEMKELRMRSLACEIKAHLFTGLPFFVPTLDVEFDGKAVCVSGVVRLPKERALVMEEAAKVAADVPLRFSLQYRH
ncbi:MAG: AAA family ATPase [Syntrophobacteraceae bacterium]